MEAALSLFVECTESTLQCFHEDFTLFDNASDSGSSARSLNSFSLFLSLALEHIRLLDSLGLIFDSGFQKKKLDVQLHLLKSSENSQLVYDSKSVEPIIKLSDLIYQEIDNDNKIQEKSIKMDDFFSRFSYFDPNVDKRLKNIAVIFLSKQSFSNINFKNILYDQENPLQLVFLTFSETFFSENINIKSGILRVKNISLDPSSEYYALQYHKLVAELHQLNFSSILDIPMKEENVSKSHQQSGAEGQSINYNVPILISQEKIEISNLKWISPNSNHNEVCQRGTFISCFAFLDSYQRQSQCLLNFLFSGKIVRCCDEINQQEYVIMCLGNGRMAILELKGDHTNEQESNIVQTMPEKLISNSYTSFDDIMVRNIDFQALYTEKRENLEIFAKVRADLGKLVYMYNFPEELAHEIINIFFLYFSIVGNSSPIHYLTNTNNENSDKKIKILSEMCQQIQAKPYTKRVNEGKNILKEGFDNILDLIKLLSEFKPSTSKFQSLLTQYFLYCTEQIKELYENSKNMDNDNTLQSKDIKKTSENTDFTKTEKSMLQLYNEAVGFKYKPRPLSAQNLDVDTPDQKLYRNLKTY